MKYKRKKDSNFWNFARAYLHDYMPVVRNLSDKSVETYKQSLKTYLRFLETIKSLSNEEVTFDAFSRDYVMNYINWLKELGYSPKSINLKLTALRSFLKYSSEEDFELRGLYTEVCSIKKLKEDKKPIQYLQPIATSAILSAYDSKTNKHRRNRMILILLYDTGARVQELSDLRFSSLHLDAKNPYSTLIGKGRKSRNVPLMTKTVKHLGVYLKEFHSTGCENPLFYSLLDGKPHSLSTDSISLILKTASTIARKTCKDVPENVHCHLIRKTKAMDLYRNGVPLPFIMQLLGHESMSTTSGFYAFATLEMMSEAMNKAIPKFMESDKIWKRE
ncbi:MAG: site-specific integrase [Peptostreptococcaceae bacterium]|nr:site-specific integrase [Peptostreptococcaceae bacterium]